jgi:hypothetical protein
MTIWLSLLNVTPVIVPPSKSCHLQYDIAVVYVHIVIKQYIYIITYYKCDI